jgi:hypothetical protein
MGSKISRNVKVKRELEAFYVVSRGNKAPSATQD